MVRTPAEMLEPGRPLAIANVADGAEGLVAADLAKAIAAELRPPAISLAVIGPAFPLPMVLLSILVTGMTSAAVPVRKHSSAV